jgi:hypothetical protein
MNKGIYRFHYLTISAISRFGYVLPNFILFRWKFRWTTEQEATPLLQAGLMSVDRFDIIVDRQLAISSALRKKRGK